MMTTTKRISVIKRSVSVSKRLQELEKSKPSFISMPDEISLATIFMPTPSTASEVLLDETEVTPRQFDIKRDNMLIAKGTHFFCLGHLGAVSIANQSPDKPDYCHECLALIRSERIIRSQRTAPLTQVEDALDLNSADEPIVGDIKIPEPIMKQPRQRGRPRKEANQAVSRVTRWRQSKRGGQVK